MKKCLVVVALLVTLPTFAFSQHTPPDTPVESPLWWPVFDGITARELRLESQREAVARHYRTAVEAGSAPDCGPHYLPSRFHDDKRNPQLVPLWHILHRSIVSRWMGDQPASELRASADPLLTTAGMSPSGVELVHRWARQTAQTIGDREQAVDAKLALAMSSLSEFADRHLRSFRSERMSSSGGAVGPSAESLREEGDELLLGRLRLLEDIETNEADPLALSGFLSGSYGDWSEWLEAFQVRPTEETMHSRLPTLRSDLSEADWTSLRRYLSLQIRGNQGGTYSSLDCPQAPLFTPFAKDLER